MKLSSIKPNPNNPRVIKDDSFNKLCKSIQDFPKMMSLRPIVVDNNMMILGGNMRFKALQHLGFKEIPDEWVKRAEDLTEDEARRFIIVDNVSGGEWDVEDLSNNWDRTDLEEWGLELDWPVDKTEAVDDDYEIPDTIETDIVLGELFEIGEHRLLCGDSTDSDSVAKLMNGEKADMVFTDPDFSMSDDDLFLCYSNESIIQPTVSFWVCCDKQAVKLASNDKERFTHFFVHDFKVATLVSNTQPMQRHTLICKFGNKKMINLSDGFTTIVSVATERTLKTHKLTPMAKRVELPAKFIEHYADDNGIIVDFFTHSGSTMVAAHQLKRKCYGMELDPKYCQVIIDRMQKLAPEIEIKKNGQKIQRLDKVNAGV